MNKLKGNFIEFGKGNRIEWNLPLFIALYVLPKWHNEILNLCNSGRRNTLLFKILFKKNIKVTALEENQLNLKEIEEARVLLRSFQKDGFYTVPKITWWVLNYEELSNFSYEKRNEGSCLESLSCPCPWDSPENRFQRLISIKICH